MVKLNNRLAKALLVLLLLVPILSIGYLLLFDQLKELHQNEITKNMQITHLTANYVNDYILGYKETMQGLASSKAVINQDRAAILKMMDDVHLSHPEASLFWVANTKGDLVAKYPDDYPDANIADREFFLASIKERVFVGGPYVGRVTGIQIITISVPYYRQGKVIGVVGVSIPITELQKKLNVIQVGRSGYAMLFTQDGKYISHPQINLTQDTGTLSQTPLFKFIMASGSGEGYFDKPSAVDSERKLHSFVALTEAPWYVVIVQPLREFEIKTNQIFERNLSIIILLFVFIVVTIRYLSLMKDRIQAEQIQKAEKLALVGQLAAGVAHEIRNPLTSIKGFVQLIQVKEGKDIPEFYLDTIVDELDRIDQIVGEMVVLAKPVPTKLTQLDLKSILQDTLHLMSPQAAMKDVRLSVESPENLLPIAGDANQLKQVFINLIKNAIEAMPEGGKVTITLGNQGNKGVEVRVQDSGPGIPEEYLEKLATPFFSTKEKGTGLGLMVTYRIVQNHKGEISVQSVSGQGSTFTIFFPVSEERPQ